MTAAGNPALAITAGRPKEGGRRFSLDWLGTVPFLAYVAVFLFLPTLIIVAGAFVSADGGVTLGNFSAVTRSFVVRAALNSMLISLVTAVIGAALGAILTYAIALGSPNSVLRRMVTSACGVLAQFFDASRVTRHAGGRTVAACSPASPPASPTRCARSIASSST